MKVGIMRGSTVALEVAVARHQIKEIGVNGCANYGMTALKLDQAAAEHS